MGGFCSKMEETTDNGSDSNTNPQHERVESLNSSPSAVQQQYTPPANHTDGDPREDEDDVLRDATLGESVKKRKHGFGASLLLRIGGSYRNSPVTYGRKAVLHHHHPNSPTMRASTYNQVHDAVAINFQKAATKHHAIANGFSNGDTATAAGLSGKPHLPFGVVGIRNLGNTCFLNSSLQCLSATIPLTDYFLAYQYKQEINHKNPLGTGGKLVVEYAELMKEIWLGKNSVVKPVAFKVALERFAPQFRGFRQHDSQELLAYLLDGIHEDLNRIEEKPYIEDRDCDGTNDENDAIEAWKNYLRRDKSLIVDIFQGQMRSKLQCLTCGHANIRFEPFMYLSLPISSTTKSIADCLDLYLASENMVGANQWYCSKCKTHRDATKKTDLWILPPILIIHLKRFNFNDYGQLGSKNNAAIDYPTLNWDLSKFVRSRGSERPLYDCYAVSNHIGGLHGGHYTAYSLNRFNDQWYEFNDSSYRTVDTVEMQRNSRSAYVLFYNRSQGGGYSAADGINLPAPPLEGNPHQEGEIVERKTGAGRTLPLIRRQSVSRPDLWPHTQVRGSHFREFSRQSARQMPPLLPFPDAASGDHDESSRVNVVVVERNDTGLEDGKMSPSSPLNSIEVEAYGSRDRRSPSNDHKLASA
jgi:ubiquitin carboxyl-terminal hydrolase 8